MTVAKRVGSAFSGILQDLPEVMSSAISEETYESIVGDQFAGNGDEIQAFKAASNSLSESKLWAAVQVISEWEGASSEGADCSDKLWAAVEAAGSCEAPYRQILGALHCAQSALQGPSSEGAGSASARLDRAAAAASLYLVLQRQPGARGRGMCSALTFHQVLNVTTAIAAAPPKSSAQAARGEDDDDDDDEEPLAEESNDAMDEDQPGRRPRRAAAVASRQGSGSRKGRRAETGPGPARVLVELSKSLNFLPLASQEQSGSDDRGGVQDTDNESLCRLIDAVCACLASGTPLVAPAAGQTLLALYGSASLRKEGTPLLLKGIMPVLLCEKAYGMGGGRPGRLAAVQVVKGLLEELPSLNGGLASPEPGEEGESASLATSLLVLIEHLCHRAPEKAETRTAVVETVEIILRRLPEAHRRQFSTFASLFSRSAKVNHRVFAVDLIAELLKTDWLWHDRRPPAALPPTTPAAAAATSESTALRLLGMLVARCADRAPTVRARALGALSALAGAARDSVDHSAMAPLTVALLRPVFTVDPPSAPDRKTPSAASNAATPGGTASSRSMSLRALLKRRLEDDRALVRRAAAQALAALAALHLMHRSTRPGDGAQADDGEEGAAAGEWDEELGALGHLCADVSVATRKAAAAGLSSLRALLPRAAQLRHLWCTHVLPLAHDGEATVAARCGDLVKEALVDPVASGPPPSDSVWSLLAAAHSAEAQKCLQAALWPVALRQPEKPLADPACFVGGPILHGKVLHALRAAALLGCRPSGDANSAQELSSHGNASADALTSAQRICVRQGAWVLFEAVLCPTVSSGSSTVQAVALSPQTAPIEPAFVLACWRDLWAQVDSLDPSQEGAGLELTALEVDAQRMLRAIAHLAPAVPAPDAAALAAELLALLQALEATPATSAAMLKALVALCSAKAPTQAQALAISASFAAALLDRAQSLLEEYAFGQDASNGGAAEMVTSVERALHLVGEVALLGFSPDDNGVGCDGRPVLAVSVDAQLTSLVRVLMAHTLPSTKPNAGAIEMGSGENDSEPAASDELGGAAVPDSVRAFALVALGKLCLLDQGLAKECVTLLVREIDHLHTPEDGAPSTGTLSASNQGSPAVQSNALLVLGDLCVRYTALVERHLPALARCLQSPHALLRRHALLLLSQLLLQDFLKWRGLLLSRFLLACCDEDAEVAQLARFLITGPLAQKQPALLNHAPVDLLFILNGFEEHPKYQAALLQGSEGQGHAAVDFSGVGNADGAVAPSVRSAVLSFVCGSLTDEQRIEATARIAHEVLSAAATGTLPTAAAPTPAGKTPIKAVSTAAKGFAVLRDALALLSSPELRVGRGGKEGADSVTEEELVTAAANGHAAAAAQQGMEAAKGRLLSKMSRKQLMEHVVPIVLQLKKCLENSYSPLLGDLMAFLAELARAHRSEVRAVLAVVDPVLGKEVEYDLKQFDKLQKAQAANQDAAQRSTKGFVSPALPHAGPRTVGFASPSGRAATASGAMPKSAPKSGSGAVTALKGLATPKFKGLDATPKTDRAGRTPAAALSAALSAKRAQQNEPEASSADEPGGVEDNGMISTAGLPDSDNTIAPHLSPVPFRMAPTRMVLEPRSSNTAPQLWAVALPDAQDSGSINSSSPNSADENRSNEPNAMLPPAAKTKRGAAESPPVAPSSPAAAGAPGKQAADAKTPGSARRSKKKSNAAHSPMGPSAPLDSLQGLSRAPSHRTPGQSARKKKTKA